MYFDLWITMFTRLLFYCPWKVLLREVFRLDESSHVHQAIRLQNASIGKKNKHIKHIVLVSLQNTHCKEVLLSTAWCVSAGKRERERKRESLQPFKPWFEAWKKRKVSLAIWDHFDLVWANKPLPATPTVSMDSSVLSASWAGPPPELENWQPRTLFKDPASKTST